MIIVKKFTTETSHRVLSCTSKKCNSLHGHSYTIEVALEGSPHNQANMVLDFSALKETIKPFIESFDHCQLFTSYDNKDYINFMKETCNRWIEAPFNLSCEMMALMIFKYCQILLDKFKNKYYNYRFHRGDNTLPMYLLHGFATQIYV